MALILSVSRRTDIPAFYSEWFFNRIKEGYLLVRNPMNSHQVSRINLDPSAIDCIVFWTKNPRPMMNRLSELKAYNFYFQFTLNSYDNTIELNVPKKKYLMDTFIELSEKIGKERVVWRYDPILLSDRFDKEYHCQWFEYLAERLRNYTNKCVISFLDMYSKTKRNLKDIELMPIDTSDMIEIASEFSRIANKYGLVIETCAEDIDLDECGIKHGKCIDDNLISKIIGKEIAIAKDPNQRENCGCVKSIDIGAYNTCKHHCLYCYANFNEKMVYKNVQLHRADSPLLFGELEENDRVVDRKMESHVDGQISFFRERK